jgi:cytidine deaminase
MTQDELMQRARDAAANSYAPYSRFHVGAALQTEDGTVYVGVNVENRSYGLGICAERSAVFAAVSHGHTRIVRMAVYSPDTTEPLPPCGACRQVISEFMQPDAPISYVDHQGNTITKTVAELLPFDSLQDLHERV